MQTDCLLLIDIPSHVSSMAHTLINRWNAETDEANRRTSSACLTQQPADVLVILTEISSIQ